jgi:hypothetical protein
MNNLSSFVALPVGAVPYEPSPVRVDINDVAMVLFDEAASVAEIGHHLVFGGGAFADSGGDITLANSTSGSIQSD